jgi:hypothetical protein
MGRGKDRLFKVPRPARAGMITNQNPEERKDEG